jgi:phosphoribosylglycinamide formyltransferase-1
MLKLAVFASGKGSNLQAIIDACSKGQLDAQVETVISNNSNAFALTRAQAIGIATYHISQKKYPSHDDYLALLMTVLQRHDVELIVLAGYMKLLPKEIVDHYYGRVINIHPALLPKYGGPGMYGKNVHESVLANGEKYSGATVHIVDFKFDHGPILIQRRVNVYPDDTPDTLAARIIKIEHIILARAIALFIK